MSRTRYPLHSDCPSNLADIDSLVLGDSTRFRVDLPMINFWWCTDEDCAVCEDEDPCADCRGCIRCI